MTLLDQIKRDEGLRLLPYKDTVGKLTIGYGRNLDDVGISRDEAEYLLANDIAKVRIQLTQALPWITKLTLPRQGVLINMAFNLGIGDAESGKGLLGFKNMLALIKAGSYKHAAEAGLKSLWAKQVGPRAERLMLQLVTDVWQ